MGCGSVRVAQNRLQEENVAWRSLNTTHKEISFGIVEYVQSPSEAWEHLCAYYQSDRRPRSKRLAVAPERVQHAYIDTKR